MSGSWIKALELSSRMQRIRTFGSEIPEIYGLKLQPDIEYTTYNLDAYVNPRRIRRVDKVVITDIWRTNFSCGRVRNQFFLLISVCHLSVKY